MTVEYEVVPDDMRIKRNDFLHDPMISDLIAGKTIKIKDFTKSSSYYKIARSNNKRLRTRGLPENYTIVWMEDAPTGQSVSGVTVTEIEKETEKTKERV